LHRGIKIKILVTGGAGYIGSHMVRRLIELGHSIVTFDNLSTGFRDAVLGGEFVEGCLHDKTALSSLFNSHQFDSVLHFAGSISVGESVRNPAKYFQNNITGTLNLLDVMLMYDVKKLIFSSTAAIFGVPKYVPIDEQHPQSPINPYGMTKWVTERILRDYDIAYGLRSVVLRYFNAAGAAPDAALGERHDPETHLIPLVIRAAKGDVPELTVFGNDYDTHDGTCVRDYIHVLDLCDAHLLALRHLTASGKSCEYNLGNGEGYSVKEVIETVERVCGMNVPVHFGPRREGDPPILVADSSKIRKDWNWSPQFSSLEQMVEHAWRWEINKSH
jgi:UDP-glucose 4-epimerase